MTTLIGRSDACIISYTASANSGFGMHTVYSISGQPDVYTGDLTTTDGYQLTVFLTWRSMLSTVSLVDGTITDLIVANDNVGMGTCVETLDSEGESLAAAISTEGNYAICHWMYYKGQTIGTTHNAVGGTSAANWGETRYYNEVEWGTAGSHITGANIQSNGTPIDARNSFALSETDLTTFVNNAVYTMSWY
jgi:hypothetical protein